MLWNVWEMGANTYGVIHLYTDLSDMSVKILESFKRPKMWNDGASITEA